MNKLNLKNINLQAPYTVHEREDKQHEFYFWSESWKAKTILWL